MPELGRSRTLRVPSFVLQGGNLARPKRFELLTPRFVVWCSIQLSYGRVFRWHWMGVTPADAACIPKHVRGRESAP
jgi:hypothetical protein